MRLITTMTFLAVTSTAAMAAPVLSRHSLTEFGPNIAPNIDQNIELAQYNPGQGSRFAPMGYDPLARHAPNGKPQPPTNSGQPKQPAQAEKSQIPGAPPPGPYAPNSAYGNGNGGMNTGGQVQMGYQQQYRTGPNNAPYPPQAWPQHQRPQMPAAPANAGHAAGAPQPNQPGSQQPAPGSIAPQIQKPNVATVNPVKNTTANATQPAPQPTHPIGRAPVPGPHYYPYPNYPRMPMPYMGYPPRPMIGPYGSPPPHMGWQQPRPHPQAPAANVQGQPQATTSAKGSTTSGQKPDTAKKSSTSPRQSGGSQFAGQKPQQGQQPQRPPLRPRWQPHPARGQQTWPPHQGQNQGAGQPQWRAPQQPAGGAAQMPRQPIWPQQPSAYPQQRQTTGQPTGQSTGRPTGQPQWRPQQPPAETKAGRLQQPVWPSQQPSYPKQPRQAAGQPAVQPQWRAPQQPTGSTPQMPRRPMWPPQQPGNQNQGHAIGQPQWQPSQQPTAGAAQIPPQPAWPPQQGRTSQGWPTYPATGQITGQGNWSAGTQGATGSAPHQPGTGNGRR